MSSPAIRPLSHSRLWFAAAGIALVTAAVFANGVSGAFVLDDVGAILANPTLRRPWKLLPLLEGPHGGFTVSGRPTLNLSFALNFAGSGTASFGYHFANIAIHAAAAVLLFGVLHRMFSRGAVRSPATLAGLVAVLWAVHPLQTESVTYLSQRAESLMGLCFLICVYCFLRSVDSPRPTRWQLGSAAAFLLGIGTKENMVAALPVLFLYDALFVAKSTREAFRLRRGFYLALFGIGGLLVLTLVFLGGRGGLVGLGAQGTPLSYALTQPLAVLTYLKLVFVPWPLVFEYGRIAPDTGLALAAEIAAIVSLLALTLFALRKAPAIGFAAACFFLILAPTSLVPGTTQMIVEHRMYLPLACVLSLAVLGIDRWLGVRTCVALFGLAAVGLGFLTWQRNEVYRTEVSLWKDTVAKRPMNVLAHHNLGSAYAKLPGHRGEAVYEYQRALQLDPGLAVAYNELGALLIEDPRTYAAGLDDLRKAAQLDSSNPAAHNDLGRALARNPDSVPEAIAEFRESIRLDPNVPSAHTNLAEALRTRPAGLDASIEEYEQALALDPSFARAHAGLGVAYALEGRRIDGVAELREAVRLDPSLAEAHLNLGLALSGMPRETAEAEAELREALRLKPAFPEAHNALGRLFSVDRSRQAEAAAEFERAVQLAPGFAEAHFNLGNALFSQPGGIPKAITEYETAVRLRPDYIDAHRNLGAALLQLPGHEAEAKAHFEIVLRSRPDDLEIRRVVESLNP